jgi:iron(III) transport system permease protein
MTFSKQYSSFYIIAIIIFVIISILPVAYMLANAVIRSIDQPSIITNALINSRQLVLLGRSMLIALSATLVALVLGLPVAIILAARDLPFKRIFFLLVLVPLLIPSYVMAGAWIHLLSPTGFVNSMIVNVFGPSAKLTVFSKVGCAWCLGISFFPVVALIVATGLSQIDSSLQDVARLSTNWWGVCRYSTIPQIRPHLIASICLVLIFVFAQYGVPSLLGVNTYPVEIFAQFSAFYDDTGAVVTAIPLIVVVILLVLFQQQIMRRHDYVRITPSSENRYPKMLKKFKYYAVIFIIILFVITTLLPFLSVFLYAQGFTKILSTLISFRNSIVTTSLLALSAAVISTVIAFPIGKYLACSSSRFTHVLDVICWLPIAIPGTIIGLGLISLAGKVPVSFRTDSFGMLLLCAYIGMFSAFSIRIFEAAYRRADPNVAEIAAIDGLGCYQRFFYVDLPIHSRAFAASIIVVFVLAVGELNATVLLIPPGKATLGVSIDNLLHYGANATASALCLIEVALVILTILLGLFIGSLAKRAIR